MLRKASFVAAATFVLCLVGGCGRTSKPGDNVGTVRTFSLGSAHFTPFKKRPSARQLYNATLRLYDSFDTVAISCDGTSMGVFDPCNKGIETRITTAIADSELRWLGPEKAAHVTTIQGKKGVALVNGKRSFFYRPWNNTYKEMHFLPTRVWQEMGLLRGRLTRLELHPDATVDGTKVYVLEMRAEQGVPKLGRFTWTNVVYLGKNDLLPRKFTNVFWTPPAKNGRLNPPSTSVTLFHGVNANVNLNGLLVKPPKDAKPY